MIEVNVLTAIVGLLLVIIGPVSGVWSGLKIKNATLQTAATNSRLDVMTKAWDEDHKDIRSWLKNLQDETQQNGKDISALIAVMEDRNRRE